MRDKREKAGSEWWGEGVASEWDRKATHNLEFTANVLRPIWAKFASDPALNYKIPTSLYLSPKLLSSHLSLFFFHPSLSLFHSAPCICSTFGCTRCSLLSLSSSPSVFSSLWEWDSCPTMKLWKHEHPPEGWVVREQSKESETHCLLFLIEFFILIHEIYRG